MQRRRFLQLSALASATVLADRRRLLCQTAAQSATLTLGTKALATMPTDFMGLSYESPQLYNPNYFSAANTALVAAFRQLSPRGVLRLGGNLSDVARWQGANGDFANPKQTAGVEHGKTYWEWKLTDPTVRDHRDGAITPLAIRNLRGFLDATGWTLLYGLNFGCGSVERAQDEGATVAQIVGDKLLALQVGNEADFFGGNPYYRQKTYDFDEYFRGYQEFVAAVRAKVPTAPFAGPDVANNYDWVDRFGERVGKQAVLLTGHYYAMGPASKPEMNAQRLLSSNAHAQELADKVRKALADDSGAKFRMAEGNSCYGGGKPGVSDALAGALWGADYMLQCAAAGYVGVNLHGGGDGFYTPIAAGDAGATVLRPLYYGMQMANRFAGCAMRECKLETTGNATAYAGTQGHKTLIAIINKSEAALSVTVDAPIVKGRPKQEWRLCAASLDAKDGVRLEMQVPSRAAAIAVPAYGAVLGEWG